MADWVIYDTGAAAATLPPSLAAAYAAWLDAETRAQRLALLVSGVVADFRKAVAADADATGKLDAASVLDSCLRHASAVTWYMLANEMGAEAEAYRPAWLNAEIYLRRLYDDLEPGGGAAGTPRYGAAGAHSGTGGLAPAAITVPVDYTPPPIA